MKFNDYRISKDLKENIEKNGLKRPTDIQYKSIPHILKGEDLLAIAQTGTGKTAAYAIPLIENILKFNKTEKKKTLKVLVLVPTHELAIQTQKVFTKFAPKKSLSTLALYGGVEQDSQIKALQKGIDVLIATPGRMFDLNAQGYIDFRSLKTLVLDEADHMLDLGFINDIRDLVRKIPRNRQTLFLSATINKKIKQLAYSLVSTSAIRIQISPKNPVAKSINHQVAFIEMDDKRFFLEKIVNDNPDKKILVFVRTKVRAERVCKAMARVGIETVTIHRDKTQKEREQVMRSFSTGECKILIATDISARGVDIPNINYVINYDMPDVNENYVHRVGRTGRANQKGYAISFCSQEEKPILEEIEKFLGKPIEVLSMNRNEYSEIVEMSVDTHETWQSLMKKGL